MPATPEQCRKYRERLKERAEAIHGNKCVDCGAEAALEYAHTVPTGLNGAGRGLTRRYLDVIHNSACYLRRCKKCHLAADNKVSEEPPF